MFLQGVWILTYDFQRDTVQFIISIKSVQKLASRVILAEHKSDWVTSHLSVAFLHIPIRCLAWRKHSVHISWMHVLSVLLKLQIGVNTCLIKCSCVHSFQKVHVITTCFGVWGFWFTLVQVYSVCLMHPKDNLKGTERSKIKDFMTMSFGPVQVILHIVGSIFLKTTCNWYNI